MKTKRTYKWIALLLASTIIVNSTSISIFAQSGQEPYNIGMENDAASLNLKKIAGYSSGMTDADGGVMEIVAYNTVNGYAYSVNGKSGKLVAISLNGLSANLTGTEIDMKSMVNKADFIYGDMTSVAVSPDGSKIAVAIQADGYSDKGRIALLKCNKDGTVKLESLIEVGVQPDMVTFTPDGTKILSANEGEPREGYGENVLDPKGSVSIINVDDNSVETIGFEAFDNDEARRALVADGVVLKKNTAPSVDLEPEYIACTNTIAYVSLQEANAIAMLDLDSSSFKGIYSCGFEDYSTIKVDIDKGDEKYNPSTYSGVYGIRMPDAISLYTVDGIDYILTANEGDSREWGDENTDTYHCNEKEVKKNGASPMGNIPKDTIGGKVVYFDTSDYDGLIDGNDYLFGGRSFTMFKVTDSGIEEVYDSRDDFERRTSEYFPTYFNCSNDDLSIDDRSGKKGPEPETVTVGKVNGKAYAFVALERIGGIMVYDITRPDSIKYVNYINSRDFSDDVAADDSPEGLCFVPAKKSPTGEAILLAACEVGGTVAIYELHEHIYDNDCDTTCNGCNHVREINHNYTVLKSDDIEHWYECCVCGKEKEGSREEHKNGTATCTDKAKCSICGKKYGDLNDHYETEIKYVKSASCSEEGYTGDTYCKICGEKLEKGKVIAKTEHSYKWVVSKKPTTTENGLKYEECSVCKDKRNVDTIIPRTESISPQTGDSENVLLWVTMIFISGIGIVLSTVYGRRKEQNR